LDKKLKQILKNTLFFCIYYSGALPLLIFVLTKLGKQHCAVILFYHRLSSGPPDIYQLPHLDVREFKKQMRHVKKYYSVVTMDEMADRLAQKKNFAVPSIIITFDDGFVNNYTLAYPILKELGLPAMIYLTTGFIGTMKTPWVDDLMEMLSVTKGERLCFPELLGDEVLDIRTRRQKRHAVSRLFQLMLRLDHQRKIQSMNKLAKILRVDDISSDNADRKMLNWQEAIEMSKNNIYFGAHTVTHPTLSKMDLPEAEREIYNSKRAIENRLGNKAKHFAIPNGKKEDFSEELKQYCKDIGMDTVVSTEPGLASSQSDRYFLKRIIPPPAMHIFACELARYVFFKKTV
jgi:peptidoglycan/xylan/chitin deacetylase (PgdA/CDA1 family)